MRQQEIKETIDKFIDEHIEMLKEKLSEEGRLNPTIYMAGYKKADDVVGMIVAPIMGEIKDSNRFQNFVDSHVIPSIFEEAASLDIVPICFSIAYECQMFAVKLDDKDFKEKVKNYKNLEKVDGLVIMFETKTDSYIKCFTITKDGMSINQEGEVIENIVYGPYIDTDENPIKTESKEQYKKLFEKYS